MDYRSAQSDWLIVFLFHIVVIRNRLDLQRTALQLLAQGRTLGNYNHTCMCIWIRKCNFYPIGLVIACCCCCCCLCWYFWSIPGAIFWVGVSSLLPGTGSLTGEKGFEAWWRSCYQSQMFVWLGTQKIAPPRQSFWHDPLDTATLFHWQCKFHEVSSASSWHPAISSSQPLPCHLAISWNIFAPVIFAPRILN